MLIACAKAFLIVMIFMHVRYEAPIVRLFAASGFLWLGILFSFLLSSASPDREPSAPRERRSTPPPRPLLTDSAALRHRDSPAAAIVRGTSPRDRRSPGRYNRS
jgi:hypothetical protein